MSRILIVEDNPESRYMLEQLLASKGHNIITAENGEDALRLARQDPPELIISDIMMPVMNGFRLCREVKGDPGLRNIPFVFYTATFVEKDDEILAMSLGASRFILKPTEGERFIQILEEVLDEHRQGILPVPEEPFHGERTLLDMYDNSIARKLAETVGKLQNERKALIKSEQRLKEAQELAHMGHWELDLKSRALEWSDEIYRILRLKPQEFDGSFEAFIAAVHPDDRHYVTKAHKESLAKKTQYDIEYRLLLADGTLKYVNERFQTLYDDDGMPACTMGTVQDLTKRKKAEMALNEAYDTINKSSSVVFTWKNQEGWPVEFVSENVERVLGYTVEEFITGKVKYADCIHPEDVERVTDEVTEHSSKAETIAFIHKPYRIIAKDGSEKIINDWTFIIRDNEGSVVQYKGIVEDITVQKRAEEALRQSQFELSIRTRVNEIFLTVRDEEMYGEVLKVVLEVTESRYGIFGYIGEDGAWVCPSLTREAWDHCQIPDKTMVFSQEQWGGIWGRAMTEKKTLCSNRPLNVPGGHIQITRALDVPIIYQGKLVGNLLVGNKEADYGKRDIEILESIADNIAPILDSRLDKEQQEREKKQVQAQFHHAQKMEAVGVLAGGVAHDFNNLLTTIIGNAQLALDDLPKDNPIWEDVEEIKKAGQRGAVLTRQLLTFSRKEIRHAETLDLNKLVQDMDKLLRRLIRENIDMRTVLAPDLWKVEADPGQMEQVLMNLVVNARDVMLEGGNLTIETANVELDEEYIRAHGVAGPAGPYTMLAVTDTGPGMDKKTRDRIFEPFFTTKKRGTGTGLGLSTVYGIVKQSKGYVWPYSEPGMGTTMKVYLPKVVGVQEEVQDDGEAGMEAGGGGEVVLLAEDEESLQKLALKSLQRAGYEVLTAGNGEEALRLSEGFEGDIHLLLTDVVMPGIGGRELAEQMESLRPGIKVVFMSGYPDQALSHNGILNLDRDFIQKPFTPESLCRKVREVLDR